MTLEEKASLCSGLDFWHTKGVERLGIPSEMVCDGPHGLRKQDDASGKETGRDTGGRVSGGTCKYHPWFCDEYQTFTALRTEF